MPGLTLEPFVARIHWRSCSPQGAVPWTEILREFVTRIAAEVRGRGARLIGHIKGIACAEEQFLRINCISERIIPDVEGALPSGACEIALDLAVLVYGLSRAQVRAAVDAALEQSLTGGRCSAVIEAPSRGRAHA